MFDAINNVVGKINGVVWGWPMIILLFGTHVFLTIRTGFIQRKTISKGIKLSVAKDPDAEGEVSQFGALTTALAATIGTGNIIGVGTELPSEVLERFCGLGLQVYLESQRNMRSL